MFSSPGSLSVSDLNQSNPNQQGYGQQQQQPNQQQPQHLQQQQQPYQQQQQPSFSPFGQPSQSNYGLAGSTGVGTSQPLFGGMQQQTNQAQQNSHFGGWGGSAGSGIGGGVAGQQQSSLQNSAPIGGVGVSGAQTEYLPGYLSKLRESRPYTSPLNASAASRSPPRLRDQDTGVGPSSSPFNSDRTRGSRADIHSGGTGGTGGSGPSGSGDRGSGGGAGGSTSPNQRFTSSFFSSSTSPGGPDPDASSLGASAARDFGSKSIFGPSGLRAKGRAPSGSARHTVTFGRTPSFSRGLPSKSPPPTGSLGPGGTSGSAPDEDDFAPPIESLGEDSEMGDTSYSARRRSFANAAMSSSPLSSSQMINVNTPSLSSSFSSNIEDPSLRTILVFGFSRSLESAILDQFSNHGKVESSDWISLDASSASDGCLEIVYKEAYAALRAIRRNGDLLPGIAMVGVRWKDDGKQRESILNGINSPAFTRSGSGSGGALATSSSAAASSSITAHSGKASTPTLASNAGTPNGAANRSLIGRPISVLGNKDAVFAPSPSGAKGANPLNQLRSWGVGGSGDSPARHSASPGVGGGAGPSSSLFVARQNQAAPGAATQTGVQQQAAGAPPAGSGLLGRINDAVFGW